MFFVYLMYSASKSDWLAIYTAKLVTQRSLMFCIQWFERVKKQELGSEQVAALRKLLIS